jgi:hypothetical protein
MTVGAEGTTTDKVCIEGSNPFAMVNWFFESSLETSWAGSNNNS